jgi:hypothetical protein
MINPLVCIVLHTRLIKIRNSCSILTTSENYLYSYVLFLSVHFEQRYPVIYIRLWYIYRLLYVERHS